MAWTFSSETETGDFVPPYTVLLLSFRHGFHFSTNLYRYQNVLRYIHWLKVDLKTIWIPIYGKLLNSTMNVYNLELVRNNEIRNYVTHKQDVLSVYCLHVILFDIFFITLMFVYLQKLLNCLIIYSYKTNPSFSPCPWNLRSIGPSDFN